MLTWPCDYPECDKRSIAMRCHNCMLCGKHLCFIHAFRPHHKCLDLDEDEAESARYTLYDVEARKRLQLIKDSNIPAVASCMRNGISCSLEIPEDVYDIMEGGINVLIPVVFEDGHRWLVRIRQRDNQPPIDGFNWATAKSEAETMKVLKEHGLKVPAAYLPSRDERDRSQLCFFFVEIVDGNPMEAPLYGGDKSEDKVKKVICQLAKFNIELSQFTFPAIGGLYPSDDETSGTGSHIGPIPSNIICEETPPYFVGPFRSNQERYLATADFVLGKISDGVLCPDDPVPIYLWHLELKEIISNYENWQDGGPYYIKHSDDKGDHIMADEQGNITALIDWEWAYTTTKAEAFAAPAACYDLDTLFSEGRDELGNYELVLIQAYEELGRPDLAKCARNGRIYHLLDVSMGNRPFIALINGMRVVLGLPTYSYGTTGEWVEEMKSKYGRDVGFQAISKTKRLVGW
ncbi:hypothetical protein IAT40_005744 [Kwoniella sp. CBS 6097]